MGGVRIENIASSAPALLGLSLDWVLAWQLSHNKVKKLLGVKKKPQNLLKVRKILK